MSVMAPASTTNQRVGAGKDSDPQRYNTVIAAMRAELDSIRAKA